MKGVEVVSSDPAPAHARAARPLPPIPRHPPMATPGVVVPSLILSLLLIGTAVLGVHDAVRAAHLIQGPSWAGAAADFLSGLPVSGWVMTVGIAAALVGVWFVAAALRPRPRIGVQVGAQSSVWISPRDVGRLVHVAARRVTGVSDLRVSASRRRVTVRVRGQVGTAQVEAPMREAGQDVLSGLRSIPKIVVNAPRAAAKAGGTTTARSSDERARADA